MSPENAHLGNNCLRCVQQVLRCKWAEEQSLGGERTAHVITHPVSIFLTVATLTCFWFCFSAKRVILRTGTGLRKHGHGGTN